MGTLNKVSWRPRSRLVIRLYCTLTTIVRVAVSSFQHVPDRPDTYAEIR